MLERLAAWCYRRRRTVVLCWIAALVGTLVLSNVAGGEFNADFTSPGSESQEAFDLLEQRFPQQSGDTLDVVYKAEAGADDPAVQARIDELVADLQGISDHVVGVDPVRASPLVPEIAVLPVRLDVPGFEVEVAEVQEMMRAVQAANGDGLQVEVGGEAIQNAEIGEFGSEGLGLLAAALILLIAFGSVLAMGLPLMVAMFSLGIASGLILLFANLLDVPDFTPQMAAMIGIGVGIDYALFIITRYRMALRDGLEPEVATIAAISTAGRAVLFAGCVVVISLLGLMLMGLEFLVGLAIGASSGVLITMLASVTLLPAVLGFVGHTIDRLRVPFVGREAANHRHGFWYRWSRIVQRTPWPAFVVGLVVLVVLALPMFDLHLGFPDASNNSEEMTSRRAYDLQTEAFGPGSNGPFLVVVDGADAAGLEAIATGVRATEGMLPVGPPPQVSDSGDTAIVLAIPTTSPQDLETESLIHHLRDDVVPELESSTGAEIYIGGSTAAFVDQSEYLSGRLPWFIGAVVVLSFWLLMGVFRSVLVAVKAAIMNLLSIGAAYGVVSLASNGGWLGDLIGIPEQTPVPGFIPMMMFAILFGLSMDYEVFLLSRVREEYVRTRDNGLAVADGLATTARVITAAAAIMCAVFLAFVLSEQVFVKIVGLGMAAAIFVDATIVRMVLVPSTMELLGDRNWWYPRWLDRVTPQLNVEGNYEAIVSAASADGRERPSEPALV